MKKYRYWLLAAAFVALLVWGLFSSDVLSGEKEKEWVRSTTEPPRVRVLYEYDYDNESMIIYPLEKGEKMIVYGRSARVETEEETFESAPKLLGGNGWCFVIGIRGPTEKIVFITEEFFVSAEEIDFLSSLKGSIRDEAQSLSESDRCYMGVEDFIYE